MSKCIKCGKDVPQTAGKRIKLYCGEVCKKRYQRKHKLVDIGTETISGHNGTGISGHRFEDVFLKVDWSKLTKVEQEERRKDIIAAGAVLTGGYKLTDYEREHYKLASELGPGQHNPVSKPGDKDYDGICTPKGKYRHIEIGDEHDGAVRHLPLGFVPGDG